MKLSLTEAKNLVLTAQGFPNKKKLTTLEIIQKLGYVQIDTISVVERAHHHVLWSRNPTYQPKELAELLGQREIFEYWSHAASYLPMEHFRYCLPRMHEYRNGKRHWFTVNKKLRTFVIDKIKAEGPLRSKDFESTKKSKGWFEWKPEKKILELLFMEGTLMVSKREGFQKVYDLAERVLPDSIDTSLPSQDEFAEFFILQRLTSLGIGNLDEICYLRSQNFKKQMDLKIKSLCEKKLLFNVEVEGKQKPYYISTKKIKTPSTHEDRFHILSPFDNLVIQRQRLKTFFNFDYLIECYVPEAKRKFGYFCLPILYKGNFIGRIDAKADRKKSTLHVYKSFWENKISSKHIQFFKKDLNEFAKFNGCEFLKF